ncbi:MAG: DUF1254 domain-containing protein [Thermomicrobiales bacterium]|nr:MAG: DUF1254 domain-containing protein [Thermomicrobiales bacterium]
MKIDTTLAPAEIATIAKEAYIYAFPMMMGYRFAYNTYLEPASPAYRGPSNAGPYGEAVTLDHRFRDVITPNADTPYSFSLLDLRAGPVVLSVPAVTDRYYVMQFEDLYGQNDFYVGSRSTGSGVGTYFLAGPTWQGDVPDGFSGSHQFETDLVFLIGRSQLLGPGDAPVLAGVMREYRIEPFATFAGGEAPALPPFAWPRWNDEASRDERFLGYLNRLLPLCQPPHPDEAELLARFACIGIGPGLPADVEALPADVRDALTEGVAAARAELATASEGLGHETNGWRSMNAFGTRRAYAGNYLRRAAESMVGWGGNDQIEASYPIARVDADGTRFDGGAKYQLRLETLPPVKAFWSVTMYDTSYDGTAGYLVDNPIGRYLVNANTEGLVRDPDGGLTITVQRLAPTDPVERANWLPTPDGPFYLALRMYWPEQAALDGTWVVPPVVRLG